MSLFTREDLITESYRQEQTRLHGAEHRFAGKGEKWIVPVLNLVETYSASSVLDYGCGNGALAQSLRTKAPKLTVIEYDPAIRGKDKIPESGADLVVCTDVLEHIEPTCLPRVLDHLRSLTQKALFVTIATRPSEKRLTDGRNAHLIIDNAAWWAEQLAKHGFLFVRSSPPSPLEWVAEMAPGKLKP